MKIYKNPSRYLNHPIWRKNRLIILMKNPTCEKCNKPATDVHHRNKNKSDQRLKNLMACCHKCHLQFHKKEMGRKKEGQFRMCAECGKPFYAPPSYKKRGFFCNQKCYFKNLYKDFRKGKYDKREYGTYDRRKK